MFCPLPNSCKTSSKRPRQLAYLQQSLSANFLNYALTSIAVFQPPAPTNLVITAASSSSLNLTWKAPVFGSSILAYLIYCTSSGEQGELVQVVPYTPTFYNFKGLNASTEYACYVKGYSIGAIIGDASKVVKGKTLAKGNQIDLSKYIPFNC